MTRKFPAASKLAMLLAAAALVALGSASASAQSRQKYDRDGRPYYGANGPNRSYQQGPRTRALCALDQSRARSPSLHAVHHRSAG